MSFHETIIPAGTTFKKSFVICMAQFADGVLLKMQNILICHAYLKSATAKKYRLLIDVYKQVFINLPIVFLE